MKIENLIKELKVTAQYGNTGTEISDICADSRKVGPGTLFVALRGTVSDGHQYISSTIENGAIAVVCEELPTAVLPHICYILVPDSAEALGHLASAWNGFPSKKLKLVGITGTNGKTTIATLLYTLFRQLGYKTGLLSTVCNYVNDKEIPATHTTPDPLSLHKLLGEMVDAGCEYAFMEVSSHAVDQKRIAGLDFDGGVFTNLTRDHLDYHVTVDAYLKAKKLFFDALPKGAFALTNADDKVGGVMLQNSKAKKYTYSVRTLADYKGRILEAHFDGMSLEINGKEVVVQFVGKFNASNLLAVAGAAHLLGQDFDAILLVLSTLKSVSGRFETFRSPSGYTAIVDYAHTPDALNNVLGAIHQVLDGQGSVITVVGAGGNRDKGKRPLMTKEALSGSQKVILTSDNPRFEEPEDILSDMMTGVDITEKRRVLTIVDRKQAIKTACMMAQPGDVVLIAGKGHENYQDIKGVKHYFDDRDIVGEIFSEMN